MRDVRVVALSVDDEPRKWGYESGVGHAFLVSAGMQNDPLAELSELSEAPTACGRTADGSRLLEKFSGDRMCGRCLRVVTEEMIMVAREDRHREPLPGESVADMIMSDPSAVLIGLDVVLAEDSPADADADAEAFVAELFAPEIGMDGEPWEPGDNPARRVPESVDSMPAGPERDAAVAALWAAVKAAPAKGAKDAGQKTSRQSAWKSVREVNADVVRCEPNASGVDLGNGKGECRSCGWQGALKEVEVTPAVKVDRAWCEGGKIGLGGCTKCGRDIRVTRAGNMARHKTPAVDTPAVTAMVMVSHYRGGKAPVATSLGEDFSEESLAQSPATVDAGNKSADDVVGGAAAGMFRGRTSLTRGGDMTGAVPKERAEGGKPVPTTNDVKLGGLRTDVSARTDKKVVATKSGAKVVSDKVGGPCGYLSSAEYEAMRGKPGFAAFKKSYWRKVRRARLAEDRMRAREAARKGKR